MPGTFVLFRRPFHVRTGVDPITFCRDFIPSGAGGFILAESRYRLTLNGERIQWGPAPADPRTPEADPFSEEFLARLRPGANVLGVEVCHFGHGDGTHPLGKPGLLLNLTLTYSDGITETIATGDDGGWQCKVDRAHQPGRAKRWYLRALQEICDARLHPRGWDTPEYAPGRDWFAPMPLSNVCADQPSLVSGYRDYAGDGGATEPENTAILARSIPLMREAILSATRFVAAGRLKWHLSPDDWFDFRVPDAFTGTRDDSVATLLADGEHKAWQLPATGPGESVYLTVEWDAETVGFPTLTIDAAEGTIIEIMVSEAHDPQNVTLLDTQFFNWSRYICHAGINTIEPFEYEAFRFLQIHIRDAGLPVLVRNVAVRQRRFPWEHTPQIAVGEPALQRLADAAIHTLHNAAQETVCDGMARERQQYSGDVGHALIYIRRAFGETRLPARFLNTWGQGITLDGYFMDAWPAHDRLNRIAQRQVGMTPWGPLLDHGVGFMFDCWHHYRDTGDAKSARVPFTALKRFAEYLGESLGDDGLLPVENLGVPSVWIDHTAYRRQSHKRCAWNLYVVAAIRNALLPLARHLGDDGDSETWEQFAGTLLENTGAAYWDAASAFYVVNLPELRAGTDREPRLCDRSLATALLYDLCPGNSADHCIAALAGNDVRMGRSYPANVVWNVWALLRHGRMDAVLRDLRERWAVMPSVIENNTLSEFWNPRKDSTDEWSHIPVAPLAAIYDGLAGVSVTGIGGETIAVRPQPGDVREYDITAHTNRGPVRVWRKGGTVSVTLPGGGSGRDELHLPLSAPSPQGAVPIGEDAVLKFRRFVVDAGSTVSFVL